MSSEPAGNRPAGNPILPSRGGDPCPPGRFRFVRRAALLLTAICAAVAPGAGAQVTGTLTLIRSFNGVNGSQPQSSLIQASDGNLYGTASEGGTGTSTGGTVFVVNPASGAVTILHSFASSDGTTPLGPLVQATDGSLYGTTSSQGTASYYGTVFRLGLDGTFTVLKSFQSTDGSSPAAGLIQASDGFLYGTTKSGGTYDDGTIFRIGLDGTFTPLYTFDFHNNGYGGSQPVAALIQGSDGQLYGTTSAGGDNNEGTVFSYVPGGALTILHSFANTDGASPEAALVEGASGVFYGTTSTSSTYNGTVFEITAAGALTTLHTFTGTVDGSSPAAPLLRGSDGNFYGTTRNGGTSYAGSIFQLTPDGTLNPLASLNSTDGSSPLGGLVQTGDGSFYGTAFQGGVSGDGTIYQLTVSAHSPFFDGETGLSNGVYYLQFPSGNYFGYYSFLTDADYLYHFDLGYEYLIDANDGKSGLYLYDFTSSDFFYTSPGFPFPYLYDFGLNSVVYYYPDPNNPGHYNTDGVRYFYVFNSGMIISK